MLRINRLLICLICLMALAPLQAEIFKFKYRNGLTYSIEQTAESRVFLNGDWFQDLETLNKIRVEITGVEDDSGDVRGTYRTFKKVSKEETVYKLLNEAHDVTYRIDSRGKYISESGKLLPDIRDIPLFPTQSIEVGDSWQAPGKAILDFSYLGLKEPVTVNLDVNYVYIKNEAIDGVKCALFFITYSYALNMKEFAGKQGLFPAKIMSQVEMHYYFDINNGRPYSYKDTIDEIQIMTDGEIREFKGKSEGKVISGDKLPQEEIITELNNMIEKEGLEDTKVIKEADGIKITMENIQFQPDSYVLQDQEKKKLRYLASILARYPDNDLLISGHTALAGTFEGRQLLSEQRARAVGDFLASLGIGKHSKIIFEGYGAEKPIADNSTPEGMKKNRRVEIKILEN